MIFVDHGSKTHGRGYMRTCGQCCVAMIAGCSLEAACEACGTKGATAYRHLRVGLLKLGYIAGERVMGIPTASSAGICLLRVGNRSLGIDHWAVMSGGMIYDSAAGILKEFPEHMRIYSHCAVHKTMLE